MDAIIGKLTDPWYWWDSLPAIIITLGVIGLLLFLEGLVVGMWNAIIQFFTPTQLPILPNTNPGPTPFWRFLTCSVSIIVIVLLIATAIVIMFSWFGFQV